MSFKEILKGRIVFVGIGNTLRGDDAIGPECIRLLEGKVDALCLDVANAPENYTGKIAQANPDTIILIDAVDISLKAGSWEILGKEEIVKSGLSTHDLSPHMFIEYLSTRCHANIYLLAIQPKVLEFGQGISPKVKEALEDITNQIIREAKDA